MTTQIISKFKTIRRHVYGEKMPSIYWDLDVILSDEDMTVLLTLEELMDEID